MKKSVALATLTATCLWVASLHIEWTPHDNGHLLVIDGSTVDLMGTMSEYWNKATRQCTQVRQVSIEEDIHARALAVIMEYSPPQSRSAHLMSLWASGDWLLAEVEFKELLPAVVVINPSASGLAVAAEGVWSGVAKPWKAAPHIRKYLTGQVTGAPVDLFRCFELQSNSF